VPFTPFRGPRRIGPGAVSTGAASFSTQPIVASITPSIARTAGGTAVTISGSEFHTDSEGAPPLVFIGAFQATNVVVVDANTITADSPVANVTGTVDVTVTTIGGSFTLNQAFTFYASTISKVTPAFANIIGGVDVVVEGFNFITGSTITFGGAAVTATTFIDSEHYLVTIPNHGQGFVDVTIVDIGGATFTLPNGFQYTLLTRGNDIRRQPGITINDALNNSPNTATAAIDGASNIPVVGEEFQIIDTFDGSRLLFAGSVQTVAMRYEGLIDQLVYDVTAIDFTYLLNKYRPFGSYIAVSASGIVTDLIQRYAPGFSTAFVQTNLAKVSFQFDGSKDLATCLSDIAAAIGGGHWYVDYNRVLHFFHIVPSGIQIPEFPQSVVQSTSTTPPVITQGASIPSSFSFAAGWYMFQTTNVYSNDVESILGPLSAPIYLDGTHILNFFNVEVGVAVGALTVDKRRIYMRQLLPTPAHSSVETVIPFLQVEDNTTTTFTTYFKDTGVSSGVLVNIPGTEPLPRKSFSARPAAPSSPPSPNYVQGNGPGGAWQFRVAYLYQDGSVSYASVGSFVLRVGVTVVAGLGIASFSMNGVPIGPDVNGVPVIARFIYQALAGISGTLAEANAFINTAMPDWSTATSFWMMGDNSNTTIDDLHAGGTFGNKSLFGRGQKMYLDQVSGGSVLEPDPIPVWPNPDGPFLEGADAPDDIDDLDLQLIRNPQVTVNTDVSQLRNRIFVKGRGSTAAEAASLGATSILVADGNAFSLNGGKVIIDNAQVVDYVTVSGVDNVYTLELAGSLTASIVSGDSIVNFMQVDDVAAQAEMGNIERDANGVVTDGVHEYTVVDGSLKTQFQLYMRAFAELELFARPIVTLNYATRDPKTRSGKTVHVALTNPPISGDFLIQSVSIDQVHDEADDSLMPRYNAQASSVRFDLNDLLLQILKGGIQGGSSSIGIIGSAVDQVPEPVSSGIFAATVDITPAEFQLLFTVPKQIVAGIPDKIIMPLMAYAYINVTAAIATTPQSHFRYISASPGPSDTNFFTAQAFTPGAVQENFLTHPVVLQSTAGIRFAGGAGFEYHFTNQAVSGGAGSYARVTLLYTIMDIP